MAIESIFLSALLIAGSLAAIVIPLWRGRHAGTVNVEVQRQRDALMVYYQQVVSSLRDLQDDVESGKLTADEYEIERERWMQRGLQVLNAVEELDQHQIPLPLAIESPDQTVEQAIESAVEAAVEKLLKQQRVPVSTRD